MTLHCRTLLLARLKFCGRCDHPITCKMMEGPSLVRQLMTKNYSARTHLEFQTEPGKGCHASYSVFIGGI